MQADGDDKINDGWACYYNYYSLLIIICYNNKLAYPIQKMATKYIPNLFHIDAIF